MRRVIWVTLLACGSVLSAQSVLDQAQRLYDRTDYAGAVKLLNSQPNRDARGWALTGKAYFMSADYKKAQDAFENAVAADPRNSQNVHWLGRAWGRRAETSTPFLAPRYASKARQSFEQAVTLDPHNQEALNDLFDYYLEAPGFLGGGFDRAEQLIQKIAALDPAEGSYARAQLADHRKQFDEAEQQLRRAMQLAPRQVGRVLDLASYLAKRGRMQESEAVFANAEKLAPNNPRVMYARAEVYVRQGRNLDRARDLLHKYLASALTPDDPPREKAQELLRKANGA